MKNLSFTIPEQISHGGPEMLRAEIHGALWAVARHAQHGCDHAEDGNDSMLQLALHHAACCLRMACETMKDLKALQARGGSHDGSR